MDSEYGAFSSLKRVYFTGIKGTGMCAMAELMHNSGIYVTGADTSEVFYTDKILKEMGIPYFESFEASHIKNACPDLVIHSAAYQAESNPELMEAAKLGIPVMKYADALGAYSEGFDSTGIAGVHGKTTTTALAGTILKGLGIPAQILVGSAVNSFGGRSTLHLGDKYFIAETCEYRRHFLSFRPKRIILTSVESDHQDYFPEYSDIRDAFIEYGKLLPSGGELIYCADDKGAAEVALEIKKEKENIQLVPYGFSAEGGYSIEKFECVNERLILKLSSFPEELKIRVPGNHTALNAAAAIALASILVKKEFGDALSDGWNNERRSGLKKALEEFSGSRRRSEILGEAGGILFMDDYGHHPTEINATLSGLKDFYPNRRLVISFMSHTYTRTAALPDDFASSFKNADIIMLHKIYSSAREIYHGGVNGETLFKRTKEILGQSTHFISEGDRIFYFDEPDDAEDFLINVLKKGDLFITMGAGNNWTLGKKLFNFYSEKEKQ